MVIDGASENSPFECPRSPASYANHAPRPTCNARLETWPVLGPDPLSVRQHMVLVASEPIAAGHEIRIDYEDGLAADCVGCTPTASNLSLLSTGTLAGTDGYI